MFARLFSKESLAVLKDRKLMIAITAVIFVPLLYAGMFLWAFWDPYDHLEDIPVAIVNEDVPYIFEGERYALGDELVDKLKEEDEFDFQFVDRQTGYKGLKNEDYYILIEIPHDFSKNATTLMDDHPEKLRVRYVPNESYNFLASQIGETAMLHIEMALEENIIEAYTETMFDKIDEVAEGLVDAVEATEKLDDGADELKENTHLLKDHLGNLAEKSIEFVDGTHQLQDGAQELASGSRQLADGVHQLHDASGQLLNGASQLKDGQSALTNGLKQVDDGAKEIHRNMPALIDGTNQLSQGLKQFEKELPKALAKEFTQAIESGSSEINKGLDQLEAGIIHGLGATTNNKEGLAVQLAAGLSAEINKELAALSQNLPKTIASGISNSLASELVAQQTAQANQLANSLLEAGLPEAEVAQIMEGIKQQSPSQAALQAQLEEQILQGMNQQMPDMGAKEAEIEKKIRQGVFAAVSKTEKGVKNGFEQFSSGLNESLTQSTKQMDQMIAKGTEATFKQFQDGVQQINKGQKQVQAGVGELANGSGQLLSGAGTIESGQANFLSQMSLFTSKFADASDGAKQLSNGTTQLVEGSKQLHDGANQFSDGADQLADGSSKLAEGMDSLKEGTESFHSEMADASDQVNEVESNDETYNMMANPVEVDNEKINEVPNYGTGFAPYFLSLGLYVGALLLSIVYPLREPSIVPTSGFNWFLRKTIGLGIIGVLQALIAASLLLYGLGIEVQSVSLFYLYAIFTSWTFIALVQFLVTCFDDPGRFMAIIVLILQLTTSAGTFPLELIPKVLQPFNPLLPMTYTVAGFKAVISSGDYAVMWQNTGILAIFTIVSLLLSLSYFIVMFKRKFASMQKKEA